YQLARSIGDNDAELEALDRLAGLEPDPGKRRRFAFDAFAKRAIAAGNAGDLEAAWTHIVEACALAPDLAFRKEVHAAVGEWIESDARQLPRLEEAFRANPRAAGLLWCLAVAYDLNAEVAKSRGLVQANWHWAGCLEPPADLQVWDFVDLSLVSPERADRSVRYKALLFENRLEEALHLAPTHHRRLLAEAVALSARGLASMAPARHPAQVMVSGEDRTRGTVFFFSGLREQVWMPAHVLDVFFAALGLRAVFLRDSGRLLFLGEAPGLGHGVDGIAVSLRAMAGPGPTCTMGISGGGVPALAYAGPLAAERSLVFSTPSTLDPDVLERMGDRRARA